MSNRTALAIADTLLPHNTRAIVRDRLLALTATIYAAHGDPDRWAEERAALEQLAALSGLLYGAPNRLPAALRKALLAVDLAKLEGLEGLDGQQDTPHVE